MPLTDLLPSRSRTPSLGLGELLAQADIGLDGKRPWDIRLHVPEEQLWTRILGEGSVGLGESYMEGWWDCDDMCDLFARVWRAKLDRHARIKSPAFILRAMALNLQSRTKAWQVNREHYDLGNELFEAMLDRRMVYSCAYWDGGDTLEEAQLAKLDLVARKARFEPGMRVLEIGCGFGSFAKHAAEKYGVEIVGITLSEQQAKYARENCKGLPVEIRLQDYRDVRRERFDRVVSIAMLEAVGYKNFRSYMQVVHDALVDDGVFVLHTIGSNYSTKIGDPWMDKYIFPNGMLPSIAQLGEATEDLFVMEDWHNFGLSYARTLKTWNDNFEKAWDTLRPKYGDRFYRMWRYYLLSFAGAFAGRTIQLWQIVYSKHGLLEHPCVR